ncbi:restriction endonuclease subunit S [Candidatus Marinamargulisbacteria bacterium SCGC AAA071-K20]|nr:restriction endonuclease subunit S [Candidatus Marinamargulisbacteria bacterium SCGC AAA071-K20]
MKTPLNLSLDKIAFFNPSEKLTSGVFAKKIPMSSLKIFERKISGFEYKEYKNGSKFKNGDTLLAKITPCLENGKTAYVDILNDNEVAFGSTEFIVLRPKKNIDSNYLYYLARSPAFRKKAINCMEGTSGRKRVNERVLKLQVFPIPDQTSQKSISNMLFSIDSKIELNNKINTELAAMAKLIYDFWFVQFDFPDENGNPYKSSGGKMVWNAQVKREIPEGWEIGILADLFSFNTSLTLKKGIVASYIDMNALPTSGFMTKNTQKKEFNGGVKFKNGDLIIARITPCLENGKTGLITLLENNEIGFGSTEFISLRGKELVLSGFASCLSRSELFRKYAIANMTGTSGRKRVDASNLSLFPISIPSKSLLIKFEKILESNFIKMTVNTKENQQLSELRDWLLPMLMNGQVTI